MDDTDDWPDDEFEDWGDDDPEEDEDEETGPCPECAAEIYLYADCCRECGYWLLDEDIEKMKRRSQGQAGWLLKSAIVLLLVAALSFSAMGLFAVFG